MRKYYCDRCGTEMGAFHIVTVEYQGRNEEMAYEKELCEKCFEFLLKEYHMSKE